MDASNNCGDPLVTDGTGGTRDTVPRTLGFKLRRLQLAYSRYFTQVAPKSTIPTRQLGSLALIYRNPGLTPSELKTMLMLDAAQLSAIIRQLESRRYIRREKSPVDHRSYHLYTTDEGADEYRRLQKVIGQVEHGFFGKVLDDEEKRVLVDMLDRLLMNCEV